MRNISLLFLLFIFYSNGYGQNLELALRRNQTESYSGKPIRIVEKSYINPQSKDLFYKKISEFDSLGRLIYIENYDPAGRLADKLTNLYSANANRIIKKVKEEWGVEGNTKKSFLYAYDSNGSLTKIAENDAHDRRKKILKVTINKKGDPVDLIVCDENGIAYATESATYYYEKNALVTKIASNKGWLLATETLKIDLNMPSEMIGEKSILNEKNEPTSIEIKNPDNTKIRITIKHRYDTEGNCIYEKWHRFDVLQLQDIVYLEIKRDIEYRNN